MSEEKKKNLSIDSTAKLFNRSARYGDKGRVKVHCSTNRCTSGFSHNSTLIVVLSPPEASRSVLVPTLSAEGALVKYSEIFLGRFRGGQARFRIQPSR